MLEDHLPVGQGVFSFTYVTAWAVQNQLDPALLIEPNWVTNIGVDFVRDLRAKALGLFGTGPLLQAEVHARKEAGKAQPSRLSIISVAAAARTVHETLCRASAQLEELAEQGVPNSATCPVAGDWGPFQGYGDPEFSTYRRAPRFVIVADLDEETRPREWLLWERACDYFTRM
jgi:hypothetical protein